MDYGNTKTPSMHRRLGSATPSQLVSPAERNPNFLWEKSHQDNIIVKFKKKRPPSKLSVKTFRCIVVCKYSELSASRPTAKKSNVKPNKTRLLDKNTQVRMMPTTELVFGGHVDPR